MGLAVQSILVKVEFKLGQPNSDSSLFQHLELPPKYAYFRLVIKVLLANLQLRFQMLAVFERIESQTSFKI